MTDYKRLYRHMKNDYDVRDSLALQDFMTLFSSEILEALRLAAKTQPNTALHTGSIVNYAGHSAIVKCLYHDATGHECAVIEYDNTLLGIRVTDLTS